MKRVPCSYKDCGLRRKHWCEPYTERGTQYFDVPDDVEGPYFCSIECAVMAGHMSLRMKPKEQDGQD